MVPYFGYARQDRKPGPRTPISAKLVANLITHAGADRVMTLDLHAGQIQGFFDIPTDNLFASPVMVRDIKERFDLANLMVVSPDVGGVVRARGLAKRINAPLAIIDKRRERAGESEVMNVIGEVAGHTCILVDDIVDSGGTLVNAADALLGQGATAVYAYITHGVLSGGAVARVTGSRLKELVITDSIQPTREVKDATNIRVLPIAQSDRRSDRPHRPRRVRFEPVRLILVAACSGRLRVPTFRDRAKAASDPVSQSVALHIVDRPAPPLAPIQTIHDQIPDGLFLAWLPGIRADIVEGPSDSAVGSQSC